MKNLLSITAILLFLLTGYDTAKAQEIVLPLRVNHVYDQPGLVPFASKKTRAALPFIDDFSYEGPYPDTTLWADKKVLVNNTMSADPITQGVATFDGLNELGRPYFANQFNSGLADSLTSKPIDLSSYTPGDSIYLSFYYQPQGLGFAPENKDSLFLYFKNNANQWVRMWEMRGTTYQGFKLVMMPISDPLFFHSSFQFRFINIASLNINDDNWNLDYIRIDAGRNQFDTLTNDVAFTIDPGSILKKYSAMPYRHFIANQVAEKADTQWVEIGNHYMTPQTVTPALNATEWLSGTPLNTQNLSATTIAAKGIMQLPFLSYPVSYTAPGPKSKVVVRNQYYYPPVNATDRRLNDTIVKDVVFDNYFAYDDGTAEKSYFLLSAINFPAKTALKFTLNEPDTVRGLMVHFGAQVPTAAGKYFSIVLYHHLGSIGQSDSILLQEDLFRVMYEPACNGFTTYAFQNPVRLDAGSYYIGITQPANFGSDSIYYGLDVNRNANIDYLSYNVDGTWYNSNVQGTVMMRPIVGQEFTATGIHDISHDALGDVTLYPNPVSDAFTIQSEHTFTSCTIYSMQGQVVATPSIAGKEVKLGKLAPGIYVCFLKDQKGNTISKSIYKTSWN